MKTFGPYEIIGALGRGGMSKVYKVRLPRIGKIAALKVFAPSRKLVETVGADALRAQFVFEATVIADLRHPNILEVWSLDETADGPCYLMEYFCHNLGILMGETYWADAPSRTLPVARAVRYVQGALDGLARLHDAGIVHRDIKPFNLMVTDEDKVKLADFGLSKRRGESLPFPDDLLIGTRGYAAPEQAAAPESADARADLYAVGVTLYRMLAGSLPEAPMAPMHRYHTGLGGAWDPFFETALNADPDARFSTAGEMSGALDGLYLDFKEKQDAACRMANPSPARPEVSAANDTAGRTRLRAEAVTVTAQRAGRFFSLDPLNRPILSVENRLVAKEDHTVFDGATGLLWQQSGSAYPMTLAEARTFLVRLNETRFGGRDDWRLPTVAEILSLVHPSGETDHCMEPVFDTIQKWVWTADRRSRRAAWYVDVEFGFVATHDDTGYFYAKAVAGPDDG
jgi:eukaryotic-like serine/threonine-protein kinase